jgi:superfamily I DNA and/or RNA helicase
VVAIKEDFPADYLPAAFLLLGDEKVLMYQEQYRICDCVREFPVR